MQLYPDRIDEMAERLARHYQDAGDDEQAVHYLLRAVDRLEDEGGIEGAIQELRRAIDILSAGDPARRAADARPLRPAGRAAVPQPPARRGQRA